MNKNKLKTITRFIFVQYIFATLYSEDISIEDVITNIKSEMDDIEFDTELLNALMDLDLTTYDHEDNVIKAIIIACLTESKIQTEKVLLIKEYMRISDVLNAKTAKVNKLLNDLLIVKEVNE